MNGHSLTKVNNHSLIESVDTNMNDITRIESGRANCYLVRTERGFVLIDTGYAKDREGIDKALAQAGCDELQLIILTHGDFDHTGNAAYLRERSGCRIAMHHGDAGMVEKGDMFSNRGMGRLKQAFVKVFAFFMRIGLDEDDRFSPDLLVDDGQNLAELGFEATVHHLPGNSKGCVGLLTEDGHFFCGDLFTNVSSPKKSTLVSDHDAYDRSMKVIQQLDIKTVYPGHGTPFSQEALSDIFQEET
jgi:glyoxylase-like metal-dependent hydrolase (beta-lactamase superfamily II)